MSEVKSFKPVKTPQVLLCHDCISWGYQRLARVRLLDRDDFDEIPLCRHHAVGLISNRKEYDKKTPWLLKIGAILDASKPGGYGLPECGDSPYIEIGEVALDYEKDKVGCGNFFVLRVY